MTGPGNSDVNDSVAFEIRTREGKPVLIRAVRPEHRDALIDMVADCSSADLRLRFFSTSNVAAADLLSRVFSDRSDTETLLAVEPEAVPGRGVVYGIAQLVRIPGTDTAEFAIMVRSSAKDHGFGYELMRALLTEARRRRFKHVFGEVLQENVRMLQMARELGFAVRRSDMGAGVVRVDIALEGAAEAPKSE